jgi:hypothetical protein
MNWFDYFSLPLEDKEIRILELLPSPSASSPVELNISRAHIDDLPQFSALSYAWGDNVDTAEIMIAGQRLSITKSLETALKALRSRDRLEYFWIDQISINQEDNVEKSRQIPLMGYIYSRSAQTIGWFGEATAESGNAMNYMQDVGAKAEKLGLTDLDYEKFALLLAEQADMDKGMVDAGGVNETLREDVDALIKTQGSLIQHPALEGMIELCSLPYFTRGWIQQEIAMPKTLIFQWGSQTIHANIFTAAIQFHLIFINRRLVDEFRPIIMADPTDTTLFNRIRGASIWAYMHPSLMLRGINHSPDQERRLTTARVLEKLRRVQFSQAQDRVYGVLGIVTDNDRLNIHVNVGVDVAILYTQVARKVIDAPVTHNNSVEGVNFLTLINPAQGKTLDLPSWVPDLTCMSTFETLAKATAALIPPYHASAGEIHEPQAVEAANGLGCRGIIVDVVASLGASWEADTNGERKHKAGCDVLSSIEELVCKSQTIVSSDVESRHPFRGDPTRLEEAAWRVPVLNRESIGNTIAAREARPEWSKRGWEMVKYTMKYDKHIHDIFQVISEIPLTEAEEVQLQQFSEAERSLENAKLKMTKNHAFHLRPEHSTYQVLLDALKERIPFLGENGFVGIGTLTMQPGDLICVLFGGSFPFILRRTDKSGVYNLIGEAYCDGIMAGEALHMDLPVQKLVLI